MRPNIQLVPFVIATIIKYINKPLHTGKYYGMDHDKFEHVVTQECLQASGHTGSDDDDHHTFQSMTTFNPYNLHMGQMTVYR